MALSPRNHYHSGRDHIKAEDIEMGTSASTAEFEAPLPFVCIDQVKSKPGSTAVSSNRPVQEDVRQPSLLPEVRLSFSEERRAPIDADGRKKILINQAVSSPKVSRWIVFDLWFNTYRRFFTLTILLNLSGIILAVLGHFPYAENHLGSLVLGNLLCAILMRNELWFRCLYIIAIYTLRTVCTTEHEPFRRR
jgi:hypothetical protein